VFLYILLRFRKWQYSLGAVAAVFHDVLVVLGIFSLTYTFMPFSMEINQAFIAAILTVIGYSLNDTVVVFDRIREFARAHSSWPFGRTVNSALNSTLSRTLNTSLTTLVVLLSIFLFGGEAIRGFMFALIVGVLVGTYSSMFIATPIMYDTLNKKK
jgi:SecD/SecF fusion protein